MKNHSVLAVVIVFAVLAVVLEAIRFKTEPEPKDASLATLDQRLAMAAQYIANVGRDSSLKESGGTLVETGKLLAAQTQYSQATDTSESPVANALKNAAKSLSASGVALSPITAKESADGVGKTTLTADDYLARARAQIAAVTAELPKSASDQALSADDLGLSPPSRSLSAAGRSLSAAGSFLSGAGKTLSPAGKSLSVAGRSLSPSPGRAIPPQRKVALANRHIALARVYLASAYGARNESATILSLSPAGKSLREAGKAVSASSKSLSPAGKSFINAGVSLSAAGKALSPPANLPRANSIEASNNKARFFALANRHLTWANAFLADAALVPPLLPSESTLSPRQLRASVKMP